MGFSCGIVGLPNIGKSTMFNAITKTQNAAAENYPFCTIEPNIGIVPIPDARLYKISSISKSKKTIHNQLKIVDIAGLVEGASKGEGLGNKFLSHIREVDAIIHMVRCFENKDVQYNRDKLSPIEDIELIETELLLADIQTVEKQLAKKSTIKKDTLQDILKHLSKGMPANKYKDKEIVKELQLLTCKPILYCCNVDEDSILNGNKLIEQVIEHNKKNMNYPLVMVSANIEYELTCLDEEDRVDYLQAMGLKRSGLDELIEKSYKLLNMISFFTSGENETRAWSISIGDTAPKAAGKIHSDFEKKFIRAKVISYKDFIEYNGENECKNNGKISSEGKDYIVKDGDIIEFLHGS